MTTRREHPIQESLGRLEPYCAIVDLFGAMEEAVVVGAPKTDRQTSIKQELNGLIRATWAPPRNAPAKRSVHAHLRYFANPNAQIAMDHIFVYIQISKEIKINTI